MSSISEELIEKKIIINEANRIMDLKKVLKLSTVTSPEPLEVLKAVAEDILNCSNIKIAVTSKPTIDKNGKTFLCSLKIKSTRTITTSVTAIDSSGLIKTKSDIICSKFKIADAI